MEFITIEARPSLRCCNVFVRFLACASSSGITVKLRKAILSLRTSERSYDLDLAVLRIIPTSVSGLRVSGRWLSFRIQTTPPDSLYGSFVTELVGTSSLSFESSCIPPILPSLPPKETDLVFSCNCCENRLTKPLELRKVLPLPSNDCDPADFFCCSHDGENYSDLLEPRDSDYLYGSHYALLNRRNFRQELIVNDDSVVCERCLSVVGVPNSSASLKLWNCCVAFLTCDPDAKKHTSEPLNDFKLAVRSCSDCLAHERILLTAKECGVTRCLLLRPMEWNLELLVEPDDIENSESDGRLVTRRVVKVLYDYKETDTSEMRDTGDDVRRVRLGSSSMNAGIEQLLLSTKRLPPAYRNADGHHIGYMSLDVLDKT